MISKKLHFLISLIILLNLTSCNKITYFKDNIEFKQQQNSLVKQAEGYLKDSNRADNTVTKNYLLLNAADLLVNANEIAKAKKVLIQIDHYNLNNIQYITWKILLAEINLSENNLLTAKNLIASISGVHNLDKEIHKKLHETKIRIFQKTGETLEAIEERIELEKCLDNLSEIESNQKFIWQQLQDLSHGFLATINQNNFSYLMQGWINIALITKKYDTDNEELTNAITEWHKNFPNHPAAKILAPKTQAKQIENNIGSPQHYNLNAKYLNKIALLLPLSGPYQKSGTAIKNGFLAASYNKKSEDKPEILVLDTNQYSMQNIYQQIQEENIKLIVGPLIKEDIEKIIKINKNSIPIIALNILPEVSNSSVFLFGLPPEAESQTILEKARENRYKNALFIVQGNEINQRISNQIINNWQLIDNNIIDIIKFDEKTDLNQALKISLGIEDSNQRAKALNNLGIKFNFDPRRRQDLDCIFLITNASYARQIKPLLNFYYAGKIPVYAASTIYTGTKNPSLDRDLDGIQFCDLPWMLDHTIFNSNVYQTIKTLWKDSFNSSPRLYALGLDAYKLATQLDLMITIPEIGISGMTGLLKMNKGNIINRKLMWGTFENGVPTVIN